MVMNVPTQATISVARWWGVSAGVPVVTSEFSFATDMPVTLPREF
jgi:hypothetical protein